MQRIPGITFCLLGLTAVLLVFAACGQNAGGRCQVTSDCASGLTCHEGSTGKGQCVYPNSGGNEDAALASDANGDVTVPVASEVGAEATLGIDVSAVEAGSMTLDVAAADSDSVDSSASVDSAAID